MRGVALALIIYMMVPTTTLAASTPVPTGVQQENEQDREAQMRRAQETILDQMQLDEVEQAVDSMLGENTISFRDLLLQLMRGEIPLSKKNMGTLVSSILLGEISGQRTTFLQIIVLVLLSALFSNFTKTMDRPQISEISFYLFYLLLFSLLLQSFGSLAQVLAETLTNTVELMRALVPAYYLSIVIANGTLTGTAYYQIMLVVLFVIQWLLLHMVLPCINSYVLLGTVNYTATEDFLSKFTELIRDGIGWILKSVVAFVVGLRVIQGLVAPGIDSLKRTIIGKTASALPVVGNAIDSVTETVIGSAFVIRDCMGAGVLIILLLTALAPLCRLGVMTLMYKILAAAMQPVADERMAGCLSVLGDGCSLLLKVLFTTELLLFLAIAMVSAGGVI